MSVFYEYFTESIERTVDPGYAERFGTAKEKFVNSCFEIARDPEVLRDRVIYPFSHVVFTFLGFRMEKEEVASAWQPITLLVNLERLCEVIYEEQKGDEPHSKLQTELINIEPPQRLRMTIDFVEIISLEGAILARIEGEQKVLAPYIETAFMRLRLRCPFRLEGIC